MGIAQRAVAPQSGQARGHGRWIINDDEPITVPGQMSKSEFLEGASAMMTRRVTAAGGRQLPAHDCPHFSYWLRFYSNQDAERIERSLVRLLGAHRSATCAEDYWPLLAAEVERRARVRRKGG